MNERSGRGGQCAVPQVNKLATACVAVFGIGKDLFWLEIEKAQAHGAISHDALEMTDAAASAVALLGVERHRDVPTLPHTLGVRPAPVPNAVSDSPNAGELVEAPMRGSHARGH